MSTSSVATSLESTSAPTAQQWAQLAKALAVAERLGVEPGHMSVLTFHNRAIMYTHRCHLSPDGVALLATLPPSRVSEYTAKFDVEGVGVEVWSWWDTPQKCPECGR